MKFRSWLTLLLLAESIQLARQSCSSLDPYVDRTPGWSSGDYCAPSVPLNNYENCIDALGMQSREIPDDQLSASSMYNNDPEYGAAYGRVGDARTAGTGWVAGVSDTNQWFKIDIGFLSVVARVTTQTRGWRGETNYVTSYTIEYSIDDVTYTAYEESGSVVTFAANDIPYSVIHNDLSNPVLARYIKILPQTWNAQIAMRAELYGCKHTIASDEQALLDANLVEGWYYDTSGGSATIRYMVDIFSDRIVLESPLGMEDSTIPDGDITASSTETGSDPTNARLNGLSGWTADTADTNQYLIIDLKGNTFISKIQVQGASSSSFTETYYLESSPDGLTYTAYNYESSQKVFTGNSGDGNTGVTEFLPVALFTRFLKINPQTWTGSKPSLRVELYGERIVGDNCDFWYNVGKTTPAFYVVNVTSNPVTYDGVYCGFSNAYTSCLDYKTAGNTVDGYHWIYAAGAGNGFPVYCYFSMIQNDGAYTVISHDTQEEVILSTATLSQPYSSAGSNVHSFTYSNNVDIAEIATVAAASHFCHQSLYYVSTGAKIWASNGQQLVWWESNSDEQMTYWAGADPAGASGCLCGQLGNCLSNKDKCNADSNGKSGESTYDGGFITDKSKLPVKTLKIGGISTSESASYTLGNLVCMDSSTTLPTSCRNAQTAGYTTDGYYLLDPDGSSGSLQPVLVRCDFSTVKNAPTMEVGHNFEGDNEIAEYSQSGGFSKDIAYSDGASVATLTSLVGSATACTQYLGLQCNGFDIYQSSNNWNAWWVAQDGTDMNNWSGTTTAGKCSCGVTGSCYSTSEDCNCATSSSTWLEDKGYITDPSALPVSQIRVGRTSSSQRAIITLGKLKCHERVGTQVKTCYDAKQGGATDDGYYLLDADASGSANAFIAECNVTYNSTHASVIFNHDSESRTHVAGAGSAGSFIQSIVYENMDVDQLAAQFTLPSTDYSQTCLQHISYECFDAKLLKSGTSWWVSFSGATKTYWGGASGQDGYCACGLDGTCQDASEKCNCDAEQASWLQDSGYLVDFRDEALPVVQLRFGDTAGGAGSEEGYFTLGKLECFISDPVGTCFFSPCFNGAACVDNSDLIQYTCDCTGTGYEGTHCETDVDECMVGTHDCVETGSLCNNTIGSFECYCDSRYETGVDGHDCIEIDECTDGLHDCDAVATCNNTIGSFTCTCNSGYSGTGKSGQCTDDDECSLNTHDCHSDAICTNTVGSFTCACGSGFTGDGQSSGSGCTDDDECTLGTDNCLDTSSNGRCVNAPGSFSCQCETGYSGDGVTSCSDFDECSGSNSCHPSRATCANTVGSYTCTCKTGFTGDGSTCADENECSLGSHNCLTTLGQCSNNIGSFSCGCISGYSGDGLTTCTDVDECFTANDCNPLATCNNTIGSYTCTCTAGYQGSGKVCTDINECVIGTHDCLSSNAFCINSVGSWDCYCDVGFTGDGVTSCIDDDECANNTHSCHPTLGVCTNTAGSYVCSCQNGYAGNGRACVEIDECLGVTCTDRGTCMDNVGYYECNCDWSFWGTDCELESKYADSMPQYPGSLWWTFNEFNTTGDDKYANQDVNATEFNAYPGLAIQHDYGISNYSIRTRLNGTDDCLNFGDFVGHCISEPALCTDGLTVSLWIRLTEDEVNEAGPVYILSSGPPDSIGFSIYRDTRKIGFVLNEGTTQWTAEVTDAVPANLWKNVAFAWSASTGMSVFIDAVRQVDVEDGTNNPLAPVVSYLTLGCRYNGAENTGHSSGLFDELAIWMGRFNDSHQLPWLMGGWDKDDCVTEPCEHGQCFDTGIASYRCECDPGYNGTNCEIEIDECESNPCQQGGTCTDFIAYYHCDCVFGYTGHSCHLDLSPNYDYSNVVNLFSRFLVIDEILGLEAVQVHPFHLLATNYWPLNDPSSIQIAGSNYSAVLGRDGTGLYPLLGSSNSRIQLANLTGHCLSEPQYCTDGLSLAVWVKLYTMSAGEDGIILSTASIESNGRVGVSIVLKANDDLEFRVADGVNRAWVLLISSADVVFNSWCQLAITWHPDIGLTAYMNGIKVTNAQRSREPAGDTNLSNLLMIGSRYVNVTSTAYPMSVSDVVFWDRHLRDWESNRFLGFTRREQEIASFADYYWGVDGYARRDESILSRYQEPYVSQFKELTKAGEGDVVLAPSWDSKGNSLLVYGDGSGWLLLDDFAGQCLSDVSLCKDGLSVSLWVQLVQVQDNDTHFLISSGEQVTRGFSIYQRDVDRLGAAVTDGRVRWVVEIEHTPYMKDEATVYNVHSNTNYTEFTSPWINLGITWTKKGGLAMFKDGRLVAIDPTGYRKYRNSDGETLLILGRRNDFLDNAANFTFEEVAIVERPMETFEYRTGLAMIENIHYSDVQYFWNPSDLVANTFKVLWEHTYNDTTEPIRASRAVTMPDANTVHLTDDAYIILGDFRDNFVSDPTLSPRGMSVALWVKLSIDTAANTIRKYIISSGSQAMSTGIAVYTIADELTFLISTNETTWETKYSTSVIPQDTWTNLAFTWHHLEPFILYIDGRRVSPTSSVSTSANINQTCPLLALGRRNDIEDGFGNFKIHSLVIWDKYIYKKNVHKLLGVSDTEMYYLHQADYYWSLDPPLTLVSSLSATSSSGTAYVDDRHRFARSLYTDGQKGWARLGDLSSDCLADPSTCANGFALALWMKFSDIPARRERCLFTSGADLPNEKGIVFRQTPDDLQFQVSDGSNSWYLTLSEDLYTFNEWQYVAMVWSPATGLAIHVNGKNIASKTEPTRDRRSSASYSDFTLGKCADNTNYAQAHYDDIILMLPSVGQSLPTAEQLHGDPICHGFLSSDLYFNLTSTSSGVVTTNTQPSVRGEGDGSTRAISTHPGNGYVDIGDFSGHCLSSPSMCSSGVTLSVMVKLIDMDNLLDSTTNPDGVGYILSSGAQTDLSTGFAIYSDNTTITFEADDGLQQWRSQVDYSLSENWTSIAMSWDSVYGITTFIDGESQMEIVAAPPTVVVPVSSNDTANTTGPTPSVAPPTPRPDSHTSLHLGKRNDEGTGYLRAEFADLAVWFYRMDAEDPNVGRRVTGRECPEIVVTTNHAELDRYSVWTGTIECDATHKVDCINDLDELFEVIYQEDGISDYLYARVIQLLKNYTATEKYLTKDEIEMMAFMVDKVIHRELPPAMNVSDAQVDLENILELSSNLLSVDRKRRWISIQQSQGGVTKMMKDLENYSMKMADLLVTPDGQPNDDVTMTVVSSNIVLHIERFDIGALDPDNGLLFPQYSDPDLQPINQSWNQPSDTIQLPKNFFDFTTEKTGGGTLVGLVFNSITEFMPVETTEPDLRENAETRVIKLTSRVMSLTVEPPLRKNLYNPVEITLSNVKARENNMEPICAFWDFDMENTINGGWSTDGCQVHSSNITHTVCYCYHLTNFGTLMKPIEVEVISQDVINLEYISWAGNGLSMLALLSLLLIFVCVSKLRTIVNAIHINLIIAMMLAKTTYLIIPIVKDDQTACTCMAVVLQYFYTATFSWMLVEGIHLLVEVRNPVGNYFRQKSRYYLLIGWGMPVMIVGTTLAIAFEGYGTEDSCWMSIENGAVWLFVGPCIVIILLNLCILYIVWKSTINSTERIGKVQLQRSSLRASALLLPFLGCSWVFAILHINYNYIILAYFFTILNSLQGVFIFLFHGLGNKEVRWAVLKKDAEVEFSKVEEVSITPNTMKMRPMYMRAPRPPPTYVP